MKHKLSLASVFLSTIAFLFTLSACDSENLSLIPQENSSDRKRLTNEFDGVYEVTLIRDVDNPESDTLQQNAFWTLDMSISEGRGVVNVTSDVNGVVIKIKGDIRIDRSGRVAGEIFVEREGQNIARVELLNVVMSFNQVEGEYSYVVFNEEIRGKVRGVRKADGLELGGAYTTSRYDGLYKVEFVRGGQIRSVACIVVENGRVLQTLDDGVSINGMVGSDGQFLLVSTAHSLQEVSAEGVVTDAGAIAGTYAIDAGEGVIDGEKTEQCDWSPVSVPSVAFDGTYKIQFIQNGVIRGVDCVTLGQGEFYHTFENTYSVTGTVDHNGNFIMLAIPTSVEFLKAEGLISSDGAMTGNYSTDQGTGILNGVAVDQCDLSPTRLAGTAYDGLYKIDFIRDGQIRAVSCIVVRNGQVSQALNGGYTAIGTVNNEGNVILLSTQDSQWPLTAEGFVDSAGKVSGTYEIAQGNGIFTGIRDPQCDSTTPVSVENPDPVLFQQGLDGQLFGGDPGVHTLCQVKVEFSKGLTAFVTELPNLFTQDGDYYCKQGNRCNFLDETISGTAFSTGQACVVQCNFLAREHLGGDEKCDGIRTEIEF